MAGKIKVAPVDGPGADPTATVNGRKLRISVDGNVTYSFEGDASLQKGANELMVVVDDHEGGESSARVTVKYQPLQATRSQCAEDKSGDSSDHFTHMDIVRACARRRGGKVVFKITTAKPPPNVHDGSGNPTAPCFEIPRTSGGGPGPPPLQSCGDAKLRGYTQHFWPSVPFSISGAHLNLEGATHVPAKAHVQMARLRRRRLPLRRQGPAEGLPDVRRQASRLASDIDPTPGGNIGCACPAFEGLAGIVVGSGSPWPGRP